MSEIQEYLVKYLKKIEEVIQAKPFLKDLIDELMADKIYENELDALSDILDKMFGENHKVFNLMLIIYTDPNILETVTEDEKLSDEFSCWILGLSLKHGWELTRKYRLQNEHVDWDSISHRVFYDNEIFLQIEFERIDGKKFMIESNRSSVLALIATLSNKLKHFETKEPNEHEIRSITDSINYLSSIIKDQKQSND